MSRRRKDADLRAALDLARELGAREQGLAVVTTLRPDGTAHVSVVNAGVLEHPVTGEPVVGFVSPGGVRKLAHLRERSRATVLFRSGWTWIAIEGDAELVGRDDWLDGFDPGRLPRLLRAVYAAAAGGAADDWAQLDESMAAERHTAVLVRPSRAYPLEAVSGRRIGAGGSRETAPGRGTQARADEAE
jgi:PPOX class probable F420-dependent enzyme